MMDSTTAFSTGAMLQAKLDAIPQNENWGVAVVDAILAYSRGVKLSDLHMLSLRERTVIKGRLEGQLVPLAVLTYKERQLAIARLKVIAKLPAFVKAEPQDGRIDYHRADGSRVALRVSFLPTIHGEAVVVRFPNSGPKDIGLEELGLSKKMMVSLENLATGQEGVFLVTGPSGSGKSTTLYALLEYLHRVRGDRLHFVTIEDPVEREVDFAAQVQVDDAQNRGFSRAVRAALRQDTDVLLIGEIRDLETARIAVQAGTSGHMVMSTLHAGRAALVFSRLLSMDLDPYLVASAVSGAMAQRLVPKLCHHCRIPDLAGYKPGGCAHCAYTGTAGRVGIFELTVANEALRESILQRSSPRDIAEQARLAQIGDLTKQARIYSEEGVISYQEYAYLSATEETNSDHE